MKTGALFLLGGIAPVQADGYRWWITDEIRRVNDGLPPLPAIPEFIDFEYFSYIAVSSETAAYVEVVPPRCPDTVDLENVAGMLEGERLACFGSRTLVLDGLYGCWTCGDFDPVEYRPTWLGHPFLHALWPGAYRDGEALFLHLPESLAEPVPGSIIRVEGHFDDPRSTECEIELPGGEDGPPVDDADAETWCRQHFVVEGYDVLGTDPSFPPNG